MRGRNVGEEDKRWIYKQEGKGKDFLKGWGWDEEQRRNKKETQGGLYSLIMHTIHYSHPHILSGWSSIQVLFACASKRFCVRRKKRSIFPEMEEVWELLSLKSQQVYSRLWTYYCDQMLNQTKQYKEWLYKIINALSLCSEAFWTWNHDLKNYFSTSK